MEIEPTAVYLNLTHGRKTLTEDLVDSGISGPLLGPFTWVSVTYANYLRMGVEADVDDPIWLSMEEGCVWYDGLWYSDFEVVSGARCTKYEISKWKPIDRALTEPPKSEEVEELEVSEEETEERMWHRTGKCTSWCVFCKREESLAKIKQIS